MKIEDREKNFIRQNREILQRLFNRRIEELKNNVFNMESKDRDLEIRFINEYRAWLKSIKIIKDAKEKEPIKGFV